MKFKIKNYQLSVITKNQNFDKQINTQEFDFSDFDIKLVFKKPYGN